MKNRWYQIYVFVPEEALESVKLAMFEAGAGQMGSYSRCCWQTKGEGQFKPESGSHPYLGTLGTTEKVAEYRVEMRCPAEKRADVVAALKKAHPYECPAYGCLPLEDEEETENPE